MMALRRAQKRKCRFERRAAERKKERKMYQSEMYRNFCKRLNDLRASVDARRLHEYTFYIACAGESVGMSLGDEIPDAYIRLGPADFDNAEIWGEWMYQNGQHGIFYRTMLSACGIDVNTTIPF